MLLVDVRRAELVELADFGVHLDLLHDGGVARGDGLDLRVGESAGLQILGSTHRGVPAHHLLDKAGLGFQGLPHIGIKGAFRHVAVNPHLGVQIPLPQNAPLALLNVARAPGGIQMVQGGKAALHVRAGAHLLGRADENAYPASVDGVKQVHLGGVGISVVNEGNLVLRNTSGDEPRTQLIVYVESCGVRR